MSGTRPGGINAAELQQAHQEWADEQPIVTSCVFCTWTHDGTALEGRQAAAAHRLAVHPEAKKTRRRRGNLNRFNPYDDGSRAEGLKNAAKVAEMIQKRDEAA